jgi:hypothetical protein
MALWCSVNCRDRWYYRHRPWYKRRPPTERPCSECGVAFLGKWGKRLCSPLCEEASSKRRIAAYKAEKRRQRPQHACQGCGVLITSKIGGKKKFCKPCRTLHHRLYKYGLTFAQYQEMIARQGGACAVCGDPPKGPFHIDHCHKRGDVRGLLCSLCNTGLGSFQDSPKRLLAAAKYVGQCGIQFPTA